MDKKEIGYKISTTRKRLGITQKELAEKLHVSDKTVSKWENGHTFSRYYNYGRVSCYT